MRHATGRPFAASDERVLNVGWRIVSDVVVEMLHLNPHEYHDLVVRSGEIGEALSKSWPRQSDHPSNAPLTLQSIAEQFDDLAGTANTEAKRQVLHNLFNRCVDPREAAYAAKIIFREMRSGAWEGIIQAAIAQAFVQTHNAEGIENSSRPYFQSAVAVVQRCQLLVGDLDEVAVLAKRNAMDVAQLRLFHPIQFMLATPQETAEIAATTINGRVFFAEDKLDGIRAQVHKSGERIAIYTRTMDRTDESFPDVVAELAGLPGDFLLDGEIVPFRDVGRGVAVCLDIQRRVRTESIDPAESSERSGPIRRV